MHVTAAASIDPEEVWLAAAREAVTLLTFMPSILWRRAGQKARSLPCLLISLTTEHGPAGTRRRGSPEDALAANRESRLVSLENLWAGWRRDYIEVATERERTGGLWHDQASCVFCRLAESGPAVGRQSRRLAGAVVVLVLNAYPYASGHVLVMPLRHVGALGDLTDVESAEVWAVEGLIPKSRISMGVISAPPPAPVNPTRNPTMGLPMTEYVGATCTATSFLIPQ